MRKIDTSITQREQTTIPAEVRTYLGLHPRDKLTWIIGDGEVTVRASRYQSIDELFGSVTPIGETIDFDDQIDIAIEEHAAEYIAKMRRE